MQTDRPNDDYVKIAFPLSGDNGYTAETMWAIRLDDGFYVIDNSPFSAFGISYKDVVSTKLEDGQLTFENVVRRGGHSTYRVKLNPGADHDQFLKYWPQLALFGCTYEGADGVRRLYSIDMPTHAAVAPAYAYLQEIEDKGAWEFEEAHYFAPDRP